MRAIGASQEGLHSIKIRKLPPMVFKLNLSKVSWLYLRLMLMHVGFSLSVVSWISITSVSYIVLINGSVTIFFKPLQGFVRYVIYPPAFSTRSIMFE